MIFPQKFGLCTIVILFLKIVEKLRKLPNTKLRRDIEVQRLENYAELELVMYSTVHVQPTGTLTITSNVQNANTSGEVTTVE